MTEAERRAVIAATPSQAVAAWALHGTAAQPVPHLAPQPAIRSDQDG